MWSPSTMPSEKRNRVVLRGSRAETQHLTMGKVIVLTFYIVYVAY